MTKDYQLTYDDSDLPTHYAFKVGSTKLDQLEQQFNAAKTLPPEPRPENASRLAAAARKLISQLDEQGRWITAASGDRIAGQPKFPRGQAFISSAVFAKNLEALSAFLEASAQAQ